MYILNFIICSVFGIICATADDTKQSKLVQRVKTNIATRIAANYHGRSLFTPGTQGNYDQSDAYERWAFTVLGWENHPSEVQPCTTAQPNLDLDLCEEYIMARYGLTLNAIIQNTDAPGDKRVTGCYRHKSNSAFNYNLHSDGNGGAWEQQRVVCRDHQLITNEPTPTPSAAPTTTAPTPPPTFPVGWPIYYTWGDDTSSCPCSHQSVPQYVGGNLIDSGEGCHDILTKDDCLLAFAQLFPTLPTPVFHGHIDDPAVPRGCAWTENVVFGSHGASSFLINYHDTGSSGAYGHTVLCKNHDYEFPDDVYLPLFDPTSEWIEYTSNNCGPGHVGGTRASTGVCTDIVVDGVSYINSKVTMIEIAATEGSGGGSLMEKVTMGGCEYYGWKVYHCIATTDTRAPTTASPTTTAPTSPTATPTNEPTVAIPVVHITAIGASCPVEMRPTEDECIAIQGISRNDASCAIGGLGADCEANYALWYGNWPWVDVTPPLNGVPSGCIVHDDGGSQNYLYNTGTTGETTGNGYYEVCIDTTGAPTSAPSAPTSAPTNAPTYDTALYWQINEFYPKTDGTCAEACTAHVPNSVTGINSDDPNLCGEDEFPY